MIGKYKYEKLRSYPQMSVSDTALWDRFLWQYPDMFESVDYDLRLGPWSDFRSDLPNAIEFDGIWNSLWRTDVVAYKDNETHIIEIKPNAMSNAIGQIICYDILYRAQFTNIQGLHLAIITDIIKPPLQFCADRLSIKLYIV